MQLRGLLRELWRRHVDELTAIRAASPGTDADATRLWQVRRSIVEIETAIRRLDSGSYGRCDSCDRRMDLATLRRRPHRRFCPRCAQSAAA